MSYDRNIPFEHFIDSSNETLQSIRLNNQNRSAELTKIALERWKEAVRSEALALLAQWLEENRGKLQNLAQPRKELLTMEPPGKEPPIKLEKAS